LKSKGMPPKFWGEAVVTAVFILNRAPMKSLKNMTPFEAWHGKKPRVEHMKTFGCVAHVKVVGPGITKLSDRSIKMVFLGYESGTKGYRVFDPVKNQLHVSRDVVFEEETKWNWDTPESVRQAVSETFTIEFQPILADPTIAMPGDSVGGEGSEQIQGGQEHEQSPEALSPAIPASPITPNNQGIQSAVESNARGQSQVQNRHQFVSELCLICLMQQKRYMTTSTVGCAYLQLMSRGVLRRL